LEKINMFDRDDNIYGGDGGVFTGIAQTAIWGGVLFGGVKLVKDKDSFKSAINTVNDWVRPVQPVNLSTYDKNVNSAREMITGAGPGRYKRQVRRDALAAQARLENLPTGKRFTPVAGASGIYHEFGSINFQNGGWDNIKALNGDVIGQRIRESLVKSGMV
jgi:hypothetical protein